jgi:hypothetical protein
MKTETQLRAEIHNVLSPVVTLFWLSKPIKTNFAYAVYQKIDNSGSYSFGIERSAELVVFQVDLYTEPSDIVVTDNLYDSIKTAMESIGYRLTGGTPEFLEEKINKVIKVSRWERFNV